MSQDNQPITVVVTGAAGQIAYSLMAMIGGGQMFGPDRKVNVHLLDLPFANEACGGVEMELEDGAFPCINSVKSFATNDPDNAANAFEGADAAVMLGAFPRKDGMERKDLMEKNVGIFKAMGEAIQAKASENIKVLVVGNPANTNALICAKYAPKVPKSNFTALTRLDHNRAKGQIALKLGVSVADVKNTIIWGNHSSTQVPDCNHGTVQGKPIYEAINDADWLQGEFCETIQKRGAKIIAARKASSALSAARAATQHMRDWFCGTEGSDFVSMAVISDGNTYGIADGLMYSFPCRCKDGKWEIVNGLENGAWATGMMKKTETELIEEREMANQITSSM